MKRLYCFSDQQFNTGIIKIMENTYKIAYFFLDQPCVTINETGVEGSRLKSATRPLSLISLSARQEVDAAEIIGLCYPRFKADITLDCDTMPPKNALLTAGDLAICILPEGKTCYPECILIQEGLPCPLIEGVRYASVEHPGTLCQGDQFTLE
jgi:hypothetical protein